MDDVRSWLDDDEGRYRAVVEVEVPGTPEQIWETIATGPGIEAWFVRADVEPRLGGKIVTHHGSYGVSEGVITAWEPPRRVAYDEPDWQGPDTPVPTWNTEIVVEAVSGDTCVVRLTSGFLAGGDDWHDDVDGTFDGWTGALRNLRLYLTHFAGLPTTTLMVHHELPAGVEPPDAIGALGWRAAKLGSEVTTTPPAPPARGVVEFADDQSLTVRTFEPVPGLLELATFRYGGATGIVVGAHLYGDGGAAVRDRHEEAWRNWAENLVKEARH